MVIIELYSNIIAKTSQSINKTSNNLEETVVLEP